MCNIDRRQYMIAEKRVEKTGFCYKQLSEKLVLSYEQSLPVKEISGGILIGIAFPIDDEYPVVEDNGHSLEECIKKWSGRFIVYSNGRIYTDITNSLGVFYYQSNSGYALSSSVHLLAEQYGLQRSDVQLAYGFRNGEKVGSLFSDFFPGPFTPVPGIKRLMVYEYVDFNSETFVNKTSWEWNCAYKELGTQALTDKIISYCTCIYRNISKEYDAIHIPLTGGMDSRCCVALAKQADVKFDAYTEKRSAKSHNTTMLKSELKLIRKVVQALGIKWKLCDNKKFDKNRYDAIITHSLGMVEHASLQSYAYGQYPDRKGKDIIIHGTVWEVGREFLAKKFPGNGSDIEGRKKALERAFIYMQKSEVHRRSLEQWIENIDTAGVADMALYDRCYYEQRLGAWLSDLNQAADVDDFDRISLVNNYELISAILAYPREMRTKESHQMDIIRKCFEPLANIPVNQKSKVDIFMAKVTNKLNKIKKRVKK